VAGAPGFVGVAATDTSTTTGSPAGVVITTSGSMITPPIITGSTGIVVGVAGGIVPPPVPP